MRQRERKERAAGNRGDPEAAIAALEARIEQLTRAHCAAYVRKDWNEAAQQTLVEPSVKPHAKEQAARRALANYVPGLLDSLFGLEADKRRRLAERVLEAAREDATLYAKAKKAADDHNRDITLAPAMLALDLDAIETALKAHLPIAELAPILEGLLFACPAPGKLTIYLELMELDALPDEICTASPSGEVVFSPMPAGQRHELQLLNACSAALRTVLETLAIVPVDEVELLARCHLVNPATRELEPYPVMYLKAPHHTVARMDLRRLEPVSTVTALGGRLDWEVGRGLAPIEVDDLSIALPAGTVTAKAA
jgi:hypothetical protein